MRHVQEPCEGFLEEHSLWKSICKTCSPPGARVQRLTDETVGTSDGRDDPVRQLKRQLCALLRDGGDQGINDPRIRVRRGATEQMKNPLCRLLRVATRGEERESTSSPLGSWS